MLSGTRLFDGETVSDTLAAVLTREVDMESLPPRLPASIKAMIGHCLERDPRRRLRDIGDARLELEETLAGRTASGHVRVAPEMSKATRRAATRRLAGALLLGLVLGALPAAWFVTRRQLAGPASGVVSLDLNFPADVRFDYYAISPDGARIAAQGHPHFSPGEPEPPSRVYVRRLDGGAMAPVAGTEGVQGFLVSPDSRWLLFIAPVAPGAPQQNLVRVPIDGSAPPFTICPWDPKWTSIAFLSGGDYIALVEGTSTVRIPANGGSPAAPVRIDTSNVRGTISFFFRPLPGDPGLLVQSISYGARGWYYQIGVLDLKTSKIRFLIDDGGNPVYSPTGHLVFSRGSALLAVPFDPRSMTVTGSPTPINDGLQTPFAFQPAVFDLSDNGVLIYSRGGRTAEARRVGVIDASGVLKPISDERRVYQSLNAAGADGNRFVATITNGQGIDELWVGELARPGLRRIVAVPDADIITPVLSKDGHRIAFARRGRNDDDGIYVKDPDSASPAVRVVRLPKDERRLLLMGWTPDGTALLATRGGADGKSDIVRAVLPAMSGKLAELEPIVASPANESWAALSPDGRWLAWVSDESGRDEVYIGSYDANGRVGNGLQVTKAGGRLVRWSSDGRRIQYVDLSSQVFSLPVSTGPSLTLGAPALLYDGRKLNVFGSDLLPDNKQLVVIRGEDESDEVRGCAVVLNWTRELLAKTRNAK